MLPFLIIVTILACGDAAVCSGRNKDKDRLTEFLFRNTNLTLSPELDYNKTVTIAALFTEAASIKVLTDNDGDIDHVDMGLPYTLQWKVECYRWRPKDYGNITHVESFPYSKIWKPKFGDDNTVIHGDYFDFSFNRRCYIVFVGAVSCHKYSRFIIPCETRNEWPYDQKKCTLKYQLYLNQKQRVDLGTIVLRQFYTISKVRGGWDLINLNIDQEKDKNSSLKTNNGLIISFTLRRDSKIESIYVLFPCVLAVLITLLYITQSIYDKKRLILCITSIIFHVCIIYSLTLELPKPPARLPFIVKLVIISLFLTMCVLVKCILCFMMCERRDTPYLFVTFVYNLIDSKAKLLMFRVSEYNKRNVREETETRNRVVWDGLSCIINNIVFAIIVLFYIISFCLYFPIPKT